MRPRGPGRARILAVSAVFSLCAAGLRCEGPVEAALDQPFTLKVGQTASIPAEKVTVKFLAVSEDSRCPKGEQCITAGYARIVLEIAVGSNPPDRAELNLGRGSAEALVGGLEVSLLDLQPYPVSGRPLRPEDYLASLSLHRL